MNALERAELVEMERRWMDYESSPSLCISDCRRELREWLARHSEREAAESEEVVLTVPESWKPGDVVAVTLEKLR